MTVQEEKQIEELAYMYARSLVLYGVDIQEKYESATSISMALEKSYIKGRSDQTKSYEEAIAELYAYRHLGTVEELKEAREKQVAKKPIETEHFNCLNYECPICEGGLFHEQQYCDECGQALKWEEEDV